MNNYSIIVPDSSPLVTLAAAGSLDLLTRPGLRVIVPDGVYWEVSRYDEKPGALEIVDWLKNNQGKVLIGPTQEFVRHQALVNANVKRIKDLGERCAAEIVDEEADRHPGHRSILLYEDSDVTTLKIVNSDKVDTLTTADFLVELEKAQMIQSADYVLSQAIAAGRHEGIKKHGLKQSIGAFIQGGGQAY